MLYTKIKKVIRIWMRFLHERLSFFWDVLLHEKQNKGHKEKLVFTILTNVSTLCNISLFCHRRIKLFMYRIWWLPKRENEWMYVLCDLFSKALSLYNLNNQTNKLVNKNEILFDAILNCSIFWIRSNVRILITLIYA